MYEIGRVADTVMSIIGVTKSDIDTVWENLDITVKEGHSLRDVKDYICKKIKQGSK